MKRSFSFSEKPVLFILKSIPSFLPGIGKAVAIYYSPENKKLLCHSIKNENQDYLTEELSLEDTGAIMKKFRSETAPYSWMMADNLPFEINAGQKVQLNIFNEFNNNILLIRVPNEYDQLNDLFFIYFNQNLSNFGTVSVDKSLTTDNKTIIAHILRNSIQTVSRTLRDDKMLFTELQENTKSLLTEIHALKKELQATKTKFNNGFIKLCQNYLVDISQRNNRNYRLSDSAIEKLENFNGDFNALRYILEKAAQFAESFAPGSDEKDVVIADFHLIINDEPVRKPKEQVPAEMSEVPVKYSKTLVLLDKLENAAWNVKSQNKLLTSANLGFS